MKLIELSIHNFRGIIDQTINILNYALLVGANNAGKTTVIDAIRAFYEKDGFKFRQEDFPLKGDKDKESWIDLTFSLSEQENDSLKNEYQTIEKKLKVRKYFLTKEKLHDGKSAAGSILGYKSNSKLSTEPFYGAKNVQEGKFGKLIYIPAMSKIDEHTKLSGSSALRDLITNIMSDVVEKGDAYSTFAESVDTFAGNIKSVETENNLSLSGFQQDLNSFIEPWQTKFNLKFTTPSAAEIIKSMLSWDICDNNHEKAQNIEYFGSGFQRHFIYSLVRLGAKYAQKKVSKKDKDFTPTFNLVLFEEPEAFLHPPQQNELSRSLVKLSETDDWQVLCSTHSSHFVSRNADRILAIVRVQRKEGIVSAFQIKEEEWKSVVDANQAFNKIAEKHPNIKKVNDDDWKIKMESVKYFLWLNSDRASLFFANYVLIVEGPSETAFINKLIDDKKINLPSGIYILDGMGKYNIHRFMNLLGGLGINHSVLHDDDQNKDEHKALNELITNSNKIGTTIEIKQIAGKLENVLGIKSTEIHRKPQHILYQYATNQIKEENIKNFCSLVQSCFPVGSEESVEYKF
jgi:predicted ATP-dependent endonuclease of OLD family